MLKYFTPNRNKNAQTEAKELGNDKAEDQEPESPPESTNRELVEAEEKSAENLEPSKPPDSQDQKIDKSSDPKPDDPRAKDTVNLDQPKSHNPVLNEDDEKFLERVTSEDQRAAPIVQPTIILDDGQKLEGEETLKALKERSDVRESICRTEFTTPTNKEKSQKRSKVPDFPSQAEAEAATRTGTESEATLTKEEEDKSTNETKKAANYWAYVPSMPSMPNVSGMQFPNMSKSGVFQDRSRERMANTLQSAADAFKAGEGVPLNPDGTINQEEAAKQQAHDLSNVLSNLNLSAINNRVFSLSSESHELLEKFNIVLRDLINGGPTAYHDLETLLDERSKQLNTMWSELPPFVQTLVKSLPAKIGSSFGPELFAAAAEKPDTKMGVSTSSAASGSSDIKIPGEKRKTKKHSMPSVKNLVTEKGAVAQMLRSILNFLRTRFPAFMSGTNVLMSLAVFSKPNHTLTLT